MPALRWMAEQIPGGFFVYLADESQKLLYVNNVCMRLFGCQSLEEFQAYTGFTFPGLVYPDDYARVQSSIAEQLANPENNYIGDDMKLKQLLGIRKMTVDHGENGRVALDMFIHSPEGYYDAV